MFLCILVVAGNETTRNAITGGLQAFSDFPAEKQKLLDDPALIDLAVDEIVRFVSPVISFCRTVTADHTFHGKELKEGDKVLILYQSANRDERAFDDPFRFDVTRTPNEHVGFGAGGPHFCLGANLARREIRVMFEELFRWLPDIRTTDEPDFLQSAFIHGIKRLPVEFTPTAVPRLTEES
jgi:cytochrome P450